MKRTILGLVLAGLWGCGGMEADDATRGVEKGAISAENPTTAEQGATPRVARFALLRAGSLERSSVKPTVWANQAAPEPKAEEGEVQRASFDPEMLRIAEVVRRSTQFEGGAQ